MAVTDSGLLDLLAGRMAWLNRRTGVLAQNVANASTPGYKAKDLAPFTFHDALKEASGGMKITNPRHIVPASFAATGSAAKKMRSPEVVASGNSVELDQQMMEVSKTAVDYQAQAGIYHKIVALFRSAIGK